MKLAWRIIRRLAIFTIWIAGITLLGIVLDVTVGIPR